MMSTELDLENREQAGVDVDAGHGELAAALRPVLPLGCHLLKAVDLCFRDHFFAALVLDWGMMKQGSTAGMNSKPRKLA